MSTLNIEEKVAQYENTAVDVANGMYNPNLRAESSKEIIENFPNVRLASENKTPSKKEGRGRAFLSSLILSTVIGACCFGAGYKTKDYITPPRNEARQENPVVPAQVLAIPVAPQSNAGMRKTIEDIINKDLGEKGLVFLGEFNDFVLEYGTRILGRRPDEQQQQAISDYLQTRAQPVQGRKIDGSNMKGGSSAIYRWSWR